MKKMEWPTSHELAYHVKHFHSFYVNIQDNLDGIDLGLDHRHSIILECMEEYIIPSTFVMIVQEPYIPEEELLSTLLGRALFDDKKSAHLSMSRQPV